MTKLKLTFLSNGKTIKRTAILTDDLMELSKSKQNQADDIVEDDDYWSLIFCENDDTQYEVEFKVNEQSFHRTLVPIKAITWHKNVIDDVTEAQIKLYN